MQPAPDASRLAEAIADVRGALCGAETRQIAPDEVGRKVVRTRALNIQRNVSAWDGQPFVPPRDRQVEDVTAFIACGSKETAWERPRRSWRIFRLNRRLGAASLSNPDRSGKHPQERSPPVRLISQGRAALENGRAGAPAIYHRRRWGMEARSWAARLRDPLRNGTGPT
jgi:hypothetical protein